MCEHKNLDKTSSLLIDFKRFFGVNPRVYNAVCKICGEGMRLSSEEVNKLKLR
jgi:hypothetical protein